MITTEPSDLTGMMVRMWENYANIALFILIKVSESELIHNQRLWTGIIMT